MSLNELAEFVYANEGYEGPENLGTRTWRPSAEAIHMAAALAVTGQEWVKRGDKLVFLSLLFDRELMRTIIVRSQQYADLITRDRNFPISHETLIQIVTKD